MAMNYNPYTQPSYTPQQMMYPLNNGGLPITPQQFIPTPPIQPQQQQPSNTIPLIPVQSEAEMLLFPLNPGSSAFFLNLDGQRMYLKKVDDNNIPSKPRKFKIIEIDEGSQDEKDIPNSDSQINLDEYVKRDEYDQLKNSFLDLKKDIDELMK